MTTLRDNLLPVLDHVRVLMDQLGLRQYDVTLRLVSWTGNRIGVGNSTTTDTPLVLGGDGYGAGGTHRIKVKLLNSAEIIASGGLYRAGDFRLGPLTPAYVANFYVPAGGGVSPDYFDPAVQGNPTEVFFKLDGPGMQPSGSWFRKIDQNATRNLEYYFVIRADATVFV